MNKRLGLDDSPHGDYPDMLINMGLRTAIWAVLEVTTNMVERPDEPPVRSRLPAYPAYIVTFLRPVNENCIDALASRRCTRTSDSVRFNQLASSSNFHSWLPRLW